MISEKEEEEGIFCPKAERIDQEHWIAGDYPGSQARGFLGSLESGRRKETFGNPVRQRREGCSEKYGLRQPRREETRKIGPVEKVNEGQKGRDDLRPIPGAIAKLDCHVGVGLLNRYRYWL